MEEEPQLNRLDTIEQEETEVDDLKPLTTERTLSQIPEVIFILNQLIFQEISAPDGTGTSNPSSLNKLLKVFVAEWSKSGYFKVIYLSI